MKAKRVCLVLSLTFLAAGCTTLPVQNQPLTRHTDASGYRFENIAPSPKNSDSLLLVLTFSGGGTRAASFAYGVLEKLRDTEILWEGQRRRLLDEVEVISSVSGGSLAAAYYGLFGDKIFDEFPDKVLYRNIQGTLFKRMFALKNIAKLMSPKYGRTDMMADDFNQDIYERKTFGDLVKQNACPFIIINSTDLSLGRRFSFTQQQFDLLGSDLASYPVSHAVAASAAFPGVLTPMTLVNYPKDPVVNTPKAIKEGIKSRNTDYSAYKTAIEQESYLLPGRPYIHLVDGGVSVNLGLMPVIEYMNSSRQKALIDPVIKAGCNRKVVIIVVNAEPSVTTRELDFKQKVLSWIPVLSTVGTGAVGNFSDAELGCLRTYVQNLEQQRVIREKVTGLIGRERMEAEIPELAAQDVSYHAIVVEFDRLEDAQERRLLNDCPTSLKLNREQVDRLRAAAGNILDTHPGFQKLLSEMK
jgi:predicted acylesterase/phospholipase RssA